MPNPSKPIEQHRRNGNPGHRQLPDLASTHALPSVHDAGTPEQPPLSEAGQLVWARLWQHAAAWISPATDVGLVERYAQAWDERAALRAVVAAEGYTTEGSKGQTIIHPALKAMHEIDSALLRMEAALGLTPSDRSRLGLAEIKKASRLEQFRRERQNA
jgi:P27 family predicted phage terminase small subunit